MILASIRLVIADNGNRATNGHFYVQGKGMYCKYCRKFNTKNHQTIVKGLECDICVTLCKDVHVRHKASAMLKEALEQEPNS